MVFIVPTFRSGNVVTEAPASNLGERNIIDNAAFMAADFQNSHFFC